MTYTVRELIADLCSNNIPLDAEIFDYLCPTNRKRLRQLLDRLEAVRAINQSEVAADRKTHNRTPGVLRSHTHVSVAAVQGVKSALTGKILERVIKLLFQYCQAVQSLTNLRSSTAEIDLLLHLGPMAASVPMLRAAGSHVIGEAKCYASGFKQEWVNELCGLMQQHQCSHGILFVGSPSRVLKIDHRHGLHVHSVQGKHIVPIGLKQLGEVAAGANFLAVLGKQYVDMQTAAVDLAI